LPLLLNSLVAEVTVYLAGIGNLTSLQILLIDGRDRISALDIVSFSHWSKLILSLSHDLRNDNMN
jgi:hypothetical protein